MEGEKAAAPLGARLEVWAGAEPEVVAEREAVADADVDEAAELMLEAAAEEEERADELEAAAEELAADEVAAPPAAADELEPPLRHELSDEGRTTRGEA